MPRNVPTSAQPRERVVVAPKADPIANQHRERRSEDEQRDPARVSQKTSCSRSCAYCRANTNCRSGGVSDLDGRCAEQDARERAESGGAGELARRALRVGDDLERDRRGANRPRDGVALGHERRRRRSMIRRRAEKKAPARPRPSRIPAT